MVNIIIPRIVAAVARGFARQRKGPERFAGLGSTTPFVSTARAGLWDIDVYGHMNNASYLTHAELARWEMSVASGMLQHAARQRLAFIMAGTAVRYRREVRPLQPFEVHSSFAALDGESIFLRHNFVPAGGGPLLAQVLEPG